MTQINIANIGNYPRTGEEKDQQRYRRGRTNHENKEISDHAFNDVTQSVIQEVIREQVLSGLDEVTDGLIHWQDPISHFCKNVAGIKTEGLHRYFDTNFYYRRPVISSKPKIRGPLILSEYEFAKKTSPKPVRAVLTGPYTLAAHTDATLKTYNKFQTRLSFFADLIELEAKALSKAGANIIQIDEPALASNPAGASSMRKIMEKIIKTADPARIVMAFYFSPLSELYNELRTWPLAELQLDFTCDGKKLLDLILKDKPSHDIGFGLLNARSTKTDAIDPIINTIKAYRDKYNPVKITLTPSSGLELLPRESAIEKLSLLSKIKTELTSSQSVLPINA